MAKKMNAGSSWSYEFPGEGGKRDQLEQAILKECEIQQFPLKRAIQTIKSGGLFVSSKDQCIVIDGGKQFELVISNISVGTMLYVSVYFCPKTGLGALLSAVKSAANVFEENRQAAIQAAVDFIIETAFSKLGLKQVKSEYSQAKSRKQPEPAATGLFGGK